MSSRLILAFHSGERGRPARCLWPPAKGVCYRGIMLELGGRSSVRTIRRDAEWCDRDGRAPQTERSVARVEESALSQRKAGKRPQNAMDS